MICWPKTAISSKRDIRSYSELLIAAKMSLASDILNETGNTDVIGGTVAATTAEQIAIAIVVASSSAAVSTVNNG